MELVKDPSVEPTQGMIRVRILKFVGRFEPGQLVDCDEKTAETLCQVTQVQDGMKLVPHCKAMTLDRYSEAEAAAKNIDNLTVGDMHEMGIKNVVETPKDPAFERSLKIAREAQDDAEKERQEVANAVSKKNKKRAQKQAVI